MKNFLILGKSGVGKSSFINSVFGSAIAKTDTDVACTKIVNHYAISLEHGDICLIDTPGLAEDSIELDLDYLKMIKAFILNKNIHVTVFVSPLHDTRFRPSEKHSIKLITEILGKKVWDSSWLVFTFAGLIEKQKLDIVTSTKIQYFNSYLNEILNENFVGFKKIILIDNKIVDWNENAFPIQKIF